MKNKTYDKFKSLTTIVLPAIGTAYFSLAEIWDLPNAEKVVGTTVVLTTFFGVSLRIFSNQYYNSDQPYDGRIVATHDNAGNLNYSLELGVPPENIENMSSVAFKVTDTPIITENITDRIAPQPPQG